MEIIDVFLSRPNWVAERVEKQFGKFYSLLDEYAFNPITTGVNVIPISTPFQHVVESMNRCSCTIVLGLPQIIIKQGSIKGKVITDNFVLPTEWNQIEAAISIMLKKPTLMMLHKGVAERGLFERGAANVYVH